jgi:hypothetical protein
MAKYIPIDYTSDSFFYLKTPLLNCGSSICNTYEALYLNPVKSTIYANTQSCKNLGDDTYYNNALCDNYNLVHKIQGIKQQYSIQNAIDINDKYLMEYYRVFNLSIGIIGIIGFYFLV